MTPSVSSVKAIKIRDPDSGLMDCLMLYTFYIGAIILRLEQDSAISYLYAVIHTMYGPLCGPHSEYINTILGML